MTDKMPDPYRIDMVTFVRGAGVLEADLPQSDMPRLASSLLPPVAGAAAMLHWQASGEMRPVRGGGDAEIWLHLQLHAVVAQQCQRCLQPVMQPIEVDSRLRFVRTEDEAARLDEESEHDVLVLSPSLDLKELLEDELILALPLVPRHELCPQPLPMSAADPGADADEDEPHPFAALAALRRPGG
jgi:uncharacterized protein